MEILHWLLQHGQSAIETIGIIAGLIFTGTSLRSETKARRVGNLIALTAQHRDIWKQVYEHPELTRVSDPQANLKANPPSAGEALFVRFLILYLGTLYRSIRLDELLKPDGMERDVRDFFALPIPREVWRELKKFQDRDFVTFIDRIAN